MIKLQQSVEINLTENAVYIVRGGKLIQIDNPPLGFGRQEINWQDGKPTHVNYNYSKKL